MGYITIFTERISIHALREEGDVMGYITIFTERISIHALREEGDLVLPGLRRLGNNFYPRPPRGGRRFPNQIIVDWCEISIHALREEGDLSVFQPVAGIEKISIHALREEGDEVHEAMDKYIDEFLSTPSARRATSARRIQRSKVRHFYPRPPRGGRPSGSHCSSFRQYFYPRPPRGGRRAGVGQVAMESQFLSTPSARRATISLHIKSQQERISIHALREEGDTPTRIPASTHTYFYPRPPRGGRQQKQRQNLYFQTNYTTFCTNLEEP